MYFDETMYLQANSDVRDAVGRGIFQSGYQHFVMFGARDAVVGFQGFLADANIRDVFVQDGPERCFEAVVGMRRP